MQTRAKYRLQLELASRMRASVGFRYEVLVAAVAARPFGSSIFVLGEDIL